MRLLYFTSGPRERVLRAVLDAGFTIDAVYATEPGLHPNVLRSLEIAREHNLPIRIVGRGDFVRMAEEVRDQVCLSVGFAYLFPPEVIASARVIINVHPLPLPRYAGARVLNWVIENGERETSITIHLVDAGMDTGPILLQRHFSLSRFDTGCSLYRKSLELEPEVVVEALRGYESGTLQPIPQIPLQEPALPNRRPEHSMLDPTRSLIDLYDQIRAADPENYPAYFILDGQKVCLRLWRPEKPPDEDDMI